MTPEDRARVLSDASAHMLLATSALADLVDEGSSNGRDYLLAQSTHDALVRQQARIARRLHVGRYKW